MAGDQRGTKGNASRAAIPPLRPPAGSVVACKHRMQSAAAQTRHSGESGARVTCTRRACGPTH
eukprot:2407234-Prymnesium_polylepis.1